MPLNIDWSNLQYDPDSVAQNENILKLFLQLAVHTANRLMHLRNETDRDYNCNGRNDNLSPSTTETSIMQSLHPNLERPDKSQDEIQNHSFIIDSEIKNDSRVLLENLDQNQTAFDSTQSETLYNSSNFQKDTNVVAHNSKASNLTPMFNIQNASDVVRSNYDVYNPDTSQKSINLYTTSNSSSADEFSFEQNSQNLTIDGISERLFNPTNLITNISNATVINNLTETVNKLLSESENARESKPEIEVSQRLFGADLAKNVASAKIMNNLHENVNKLNQWSQNTQKQTDQNNGVSPRFLDAITITNYENNLNPQIVNNLPIMTQILSNAKHFVDWMIQILPEMKNAENDNNLLNHTTSQYENVTNEFLKVTKKNPANFDYIQHQKIKTVKQVEGKFDDNLIRNYQNLNDNSKNEPTDASQRNNKTTENNLSINTNNSKAENSNSQSASINDEVIKPETFEKDKLRTNYTNEPLNPISKNLSQRNETSEFSKDFAIERPLNHLESDVSRISSTTEYQSTNLSNMQDLQDSENVNKFNVEKPKKLQDNSFTNVKIRRSIGNQYTRNNDLLKSNNYFRFIDDLKDANLHKRLSETKLRISDRLIEKVPNSKSHMIDYYNMTNKQSNKNLPLSNAVSNSDNKVSI